MMNIGITCYPTYGGSGVVATELGLALADKGHKVHFITYDKPFRLDHFHENIFFHEVEMTNYPLFESNLYSLALTSKLVEVVQYEKLDLLHMHYAIPHAVSAYLASQILGDRKIRTVTTLHGTDITLLGLEPSFLPLLRFALEQSDGVTAVSKYLKEKTLDVFQIQKDIEVIPNFVDTDVFVPREECKYRNKLAPNEEKLLVHTSNFRPVKRVADVIRVFEKVNKEIPTRLLLIGDGPDRSDCEKLCRDLGISDLVLFLGKQDVLAELLAASDVFLLPSQSESFGLSALEAMSCGLPVISTSIGGIPEVNRHAETGYIAEIGDIDRMARYAVELLVNGDKYEAFSTAARKRAVEVFNLHKVVPMYETYYERIIDS